MAAQTETSIAGSPAYVSTIAGGGVGQPPRFEQFHMFEGTPSDSGQPCWKPGQKCEVSCSSAVDGCTPAVFWVPNIQTGGQWLQYSLDTPVHVVGVLVGSNPSGQKGQAGVGFFTSQLSVKVRMSAEASSPWCNVKLQAPSPTAQIPDLPASGGTLMFETGVMASALRIFPTAWSAVGLGISIILLVEAVTGPANLAFNFDEVNEGVAFDDQVRDLIIVDNTPVSAGGIQRFRISNASSDIQSARTQHVPRPAIILQQIVRGVQFGPTPEHTMYMITSNQVFEGANAHPLKVLAGGGTANNNATGEAAGFTNLVDLCVTHAKIFVADAHTVRCISFGGVVTTFAGSNTATGHVDAIGESARFHNIGALDYDKFLQVLVCADTNNHRIRSISMTGQVATIAGTGKAELKDGLGTAASFNYPKGIITYQRWNFVADTHNNALRCISPDGLVTTIAGGTAHGYRDAFGTQALLSHPTSICHDSGGRFYFVDSGSQRVRTFTADVSEKIPLSPSDMPKLLASLCDKETGGSNDLVFSIKKSNGEKVFAVCSIVKARSSYFAALIGKASEKTIDARDVGEMSQDERIHARQARFESPTTGAPTLQIDIQDANYEAFRSVMIYLHSDLVQLPAGGASGQFDANLAVEVLQLTAKYKLSRMQVECERIISESVCPENVCALLAAAHGARASHLRQLCKSFIIRNFAKVRQSPEFSKLPQNLLVEIALNITVQG